MKIDHLLQGKHNNVPENKKRKPVDKKTTEIVVRAIERKSKKEPFMSSLDILNEINSQFRLELSNRLMRTYIHNWPLQPFSQDY